MNVNVRIDATDDTCPKVGEFSVVLIPEYCTVLNTLFAVMRISNVRVPPSCTVRESDEFTDTTPGPSIELRDAVPYCPVGGAVNAAVLNQSRTVPAPLIGTPKLRSGRSEFGTPVAVSCTVPI